MTSIDHAAYWTARDAEIDAEIAADAAYAASEAGQLDAAERRVNLVTGENSYLYTDAERDAAFAAVATLMARRQAVTEATWTREVTTQRRAAWNAAVADPAYRMRDGKGVLVANIVRDLGFTIEELKAAVARHGL